MTYRIRKSPWGRREAVPLSALPPFRTALAAGILVAACGETSGTPSVSTACNGAADYALRCQSPQRPPTDAARLRSRYLSSCEAALSVPGIDVAALTACARALSTAACGNSPPACDALTGSLAVGTACNVDLQCASGHCAFGAGSDGGAMQSSSCGVCGSVLSAGQPCIGPGACAPDLQCAVAPDGGIGGSVCVPFGDVGSSCPCKSGLRCGSSGTCTGLAAEGETCGGQSDCGAGLVCATSNGVSMCRKPGAAGATCVGDFDCQASLGCDPNAGQCGAVTWADAGQACGGNVRCVVGACSAGRCPDVTADGQPCTSASTCDSWASCVDGACVLTPAVCR